MCTCLIVVPFPKHLLMATVGQVSGPDGPLVSSATCLKYLASYFPNPCLTFSIFPPRLLSVRQY